MPRFDDGDGYDARVLTRRTPFVATFLLFTIGCDDQESVRPVAPKFDDVFVVAGGCFSIEGADADGSSAGYLGRAKKGTSFSFDATFDGASRLHLKASDLGTYLLYDEEGAYVVFEQGSLQRQKTLQSDVLNVDDSYVSGAEWELAAIEGDQAHYNLRNHKDGGFLARGGELVPEASEAALIALHPKDGCKEHPELTVDAEGPVVPRTFDDGSVYGIVDAHSHMMTNFAFGGGGIFHGAPFHRLGVEHALSDCTLFHGAEGRQDMLGFAYDNASDGNFDVETFLPALLTGSLSTFNHHTDGWPKFTTWPSGPFSSTHQTQYWRWLERAWMGGLRLVVQHATSNSVMCELISGQGIQPVRYECSDMVATDRGIVETYNLERYIDAQSGGPGKGWFRVVKTPAEAREVIGQGKLAVVLGIEVSNLFDCFLVQPDGLPTCDEDFLIAELDHYYEAGIRAIFPVHKYDNAFSPGDGHRAISEVGNFANSGHWSSFGLDCPPDATPVFDHGNVQFGALNQPREDYFAPPPNDMSGFAEAPISTLLPFVDYLQSPPLEGEYCQTHGLTPLGERLITEMMHRGMIVEIDHLPQWSYKQAYDLLNANAYPAVATHGSEYGGRIYENAGISKMNFARCADASVPGSLAQGFLARIERIKEHGGYPAAGFGFDSNGFAGAPGPRFGERSGCEMPQSDPVTYPFTSYAGDVTFTEPRAGERVFDFNTEGMAHIGLLPELIEDVRRTGTTDEELEPLFRSAEGYLRMWERAEQRAPSID